MQLAAQIERAKPEWFGLVPQLQLSSSHRLVLAVMILPSGKSLTIGSLYCIDGLAMVGENLRLLAEAASGLQHTFLEPTSKTHKRMLVG